MINDLSYYLQQNKKMQWGLYLAISVEIVEVVPGADSSLLKGEAGGNVAVGAAEAAHLKYLGFLALCHMVLLPDAGKPYPFVCMVHREVL